MKKFYPALLLFGVVVFSCAKKKATLFELIPSSHSGITFNNLITENDSINPIDNANVYNGGGVGIGDFNNDGLPDIYFSGNMVPNKLYLNRGDFKFDDITDKAGVNGLGKWGRGVAVIDINNDGLQDIYVCNSLLQDSVKRQNLLYINQGTDKEGIPHFKEEGKEYGLDIHAYSTMAAFFDYNNDGHLDMYLTVNRPGDGYYANQFRPIISDGTGKSTGRLYESRWDYKLKHPVFVDVSKKAGISIEGYGHAATIVDINRDGWKDIYVTNDFISPNILYINNGDGTFTNRSKEYFKHTSMNAMGQDIEDLNNDGLADVFELDMSPPDNYRKKMMSMPDAYQSYELFNHYAYQYQYARNTLQINHGPGLGQNDSIKAPVFSETGFLSGITETDWSWTPLITDFNNDGYRDIIVTNGFPKDVTDHDFIVFRNNPYSTASKKTILDQIPTVKIHNYAFQNSGDLNFADVSSQWGLDVPTFSNGAAYADLNNDGAVDMVINNINDEALIYKNNSRTIHPQTSNSLNIKFKGDKFNRDGLGAWVDLYYGGGQHQVYENNPYRGYLSSIQNIAHFGLGKYNVLDSVVIRWPNNRKQVLKNVKANQTLKVDISDARLPYNWITPKKNTGALFTEITGAAGINYRHKEDDFADFTIQKLLPHKLSAYSPALASADIDGNGLDDIAVGGNSKFPARAFLQQADGRFIQRNLIDAKPDSAKYKDESLLFFDADGDGKTDLYIASGGYESAPGSNNYADRIYLNDGRGHFREQKDALPGNLTSKLCIRAFDYNKDGKLDLLVTGRVDPWHYPNPVSSFILRNDSKPGKLQFTDVTSSVAPCLKKLGLTCDALVTDYDNDGWPDLVIAGEWMPVTFIKNIHGKFTNATDASGIADKIGWWNSIAAGDFRHCGKIDYIVGNLGKNSFFKASDKEPVYITAGDFDKRKTTDAFPSLFLRDTDGVKREFPSFVRDDAVKQMISLRKKFVNYRSFGHATLQDLLSPEQLKSALRLKANTLTSCYLENLGNGKFRMYPLPNYAQVSAINGMVVDDFDGDGNLDVAINGNDYGTNVSVGRYDALNGLLLKGDGKGGFKSLSILQSGICIPGDGKALVKLQGKDNWYYLSASQRNGNLKLLKLNKPAKTIRVEPQDAYAEVYSKNGSVTRQEFYYGSSFLSQSARFLKVGTDMQKVKIVSNNGGAKEIKL
ncbi:VCBS repeat-containing protein [Mucilaginibacter celer]|uniref:RNA-binding protein n=1 Tax=Mucilaginibacter celer TaxID=2305508 RepID=A0A494VLY7_9SPHI|nr:VCBS repeat-containing protein [Mucilaginibacter celer]AYL95099.1 RNA-binding protein [Mucilaginibacter celer]